MGFPMMLGRLFGHLIRMGIHLPTEIQTHIDWCVTEYKYYNILKNDNLSSFFSFFSK